MLNSALYQRVKESGSFIKEKIQRAPDIGLILGSGLGSLADELKNPVVINYSEIPNFPISTVEGHDGELVFGELEGKSILCMKGRFHYYEGYALEEVTLPIRVMSYIGIKNLIVTNAAGGINLGFKPGDLMIISDHINISGLNPLRGPNMDEMGVRFPSCTNVYTKEIRQIAKKAVKEIGIELQEGVYAYCPGPTYETPAEIRAFRVLGADAIGMSTAPETVVAVHCGMKILGISCITNMASGILDKPLSHEEVFETAMKTKEKFIKVIKTCLGSMTHTPFYRYTKHQVQ